MPDESLLVSRVVETMVVAEKQILEWGREKIDILAGRLIPIQQLDAAQGKAAQARQSAPMRSHGSSPGSRRAWRRIP